MAKEAFIVTSVRLGKHHKKDLEKFARIDKDSESGVIRRLIESRKLSVKSEGGENKIEVNK